MSHESFVIKSEYHMYFLIFDLNFMQTFSTDSDFLCSIKFENCFSKYIGGA